MNVIYLILYILAAVCFIAAALLRPVATTSGPGPLYTRVNLVALGLFFWVLVPLIVQAKEM